MYRGLSAWLMNSRNMLFSCSVMSDFLRPDGLQHTRLHCPSPSPEACSNLCALNWWCHPTISSSATPFSSCLQSFPASGSFPGSWFFPAGGQIIRASTSVLPMNIQGSVPLGLTGLISLQSKGLSRVFSSITIWKHQFLGVQPSLWSNSYICTWLLEKQNKTKHNFDHIDHCWQSNFSVFQYTV